MSVRARSRSSVSRACEVFAQRRFRVPYGITGPLADGSVKKPWDSQPRLKTPLILSDFRDAACDSPRFFHIP